MKSPRPRRAFLLADALVGLAIVTILANVLAVALHRQQMARQKLADTRSAQRLAEFVLLSLQHNQPIPPTSFDTKIQIHPAPGGVAPIGFAWTLVQTNVHSQTATLIGLAPAKEPS
jgi:type II secretory pathway pseudopilin PulG